MLTLKLALRTIARRKGRMALIGALVAFGAFLIVFGSVFASSAREVSRASIIDNFTGDLILYSSRSKELPSPFAFNTPLPRIRNMDAVREALGSMPAVEAYAPYAQNLCSIQVVRDGKKVDLPLIFYAVEPGSYARVFGSMKTVEGSWFGSGRRGVAVSAFQNAEYLKNYGASLKAGQSVILNGINEGGVNSIGSSIVGIYEPEHYSGVFNYVNFMDETTYSSLFSYSAVAALPDYFDRSLAAAGGGGSAADEAAIFGLASDPALGKLDLSKLESEPLSGATMVALRLRDHSAVDAVAAALEARKDLGLKAAKWDKASGFYAQVAAGIQAFIFLAVFLVFLVVALIFMNTLIINVTERTAEIGTMRAIGTDKSFVRGLFVVEALVLNLSAALVGMVAAAAAMAALSGSGVPLPDMVSQFLIGGGPLRLRPTAGPFALAFAVVALVSILATVYPVRVATSITPLKAMSER